MSDKLGPQWTKTELERFYDSYRKYGQDWRKVSLNSFTHIRLVGSFKWSQSSEDFFFLFNVQVAAAIRNSRSVDMVEALFNMNRVRLNYILYLSESFR